MWEEEETNLGNNKKITVSLAEVSARLPISESV